jgi:hypothetical protein
MKKLVFLFLFCIPLLVSAQKNCEKWKVYEVSLNGPSTGNPFQDVIFTATFTNGSTKVDIPGFYDGNGRYKIRFMPAAEGKWTYLTQSNLKALNGKKGEFICTPPNSLNHGPVLVKDTFYLAYADGKPHHSFGTTCYGWVHQGDSLAMLTLQTLSKGYFNKIRMCIFPKDYDWNKNEPPLHPFEGKPLKDWDYTRFNPAYFRNIEKRIAQLDSMGIEADLIVFHPYDRWGYQNLDRDTEDRYIKYIIARFAAYKNVWWSMANEYDFMNAKKMEDWHYYIKYFAEKDPYQRLRGIHNGSVWYDHTNPLITHASIQNEDTQRAKELRIKYKKPVIFDECRYEGNIPWSWGNLSPEEMVNKFWRGIVNGGYVGHGDTYVTEQPLQWPNKSSDVLWWSKGGVMKGKSQDRIKFLKDIIEDAPGYLRPSTIFQWWMPYSSVTYNNEYFLMYFNRDQPRSMVFDLPKDADFKVEIIDAWNMTIQPVEGKVSGHCMVELPQKPMTALRFTKIK